MSMPEFPNLEKLTNEQAINSILTSIALEEAALSHILNAEGEKIQYVISHKCADVQKVIEVNESVSALLDRILDLQLVLKSKLLLTKTLLTLNTGLPCRQDKHYKPY